MVIFGVIVLCLASAVIFSTPGRREIMALTFDARAFDNLRDGVYMGRYQGTTDHLRDADVQVTVSGGRVTDIAEVNGTLDKDGKPVVIRHGLTIEDLFGRVIASQSLQVDVISGATLTSKAHLKAVENALDQAH
jgi:uncharacterized protein with FMN-binding domain